MLGTISFLSTLILTAGDGTQANLFFQAKDLDLFRQRMKEDGPFRKFWEGLEARADELLKAEFIPESQAEGGRGQHGNYWGPSGQLSDMGQTRCTTPLLL